MNGTHAVSDARVFDTQPVSAASLKLLFKEQQRCVPSQYVLRLALPEAAAAAAHPLLLAQPCRPSSNRAWRVRACNHSTRVPRRLLNYFFDYLEYPAVEEFCQVQHTTVFLH